jgi:cyclophilin family peptidyl-prolyl cis-trans isomerase
MGGEMILGLWRRPDFSKAQRESMMRRLFKRTPDQAPATMMELLEPRLALYQGPMINDLPGVSLQEDPNNSLVRVITNMGTFDIELFDSVAPQTVANFKNYIHSGRLDESFFHRLEQGVKLQGGGFKFRNVGGMTPIPTDPPVVNEFNRPNLARTLAMAKVAGQPNSATSQFFINLNDNPSFNTQDGGFTVFGKVIQGWGTVLTIAGLSTRDLDQAFTGSNPNPGTFDVVPVTPNYSNAAGPTENTLVKIIDIEMIRDHMRRKPYEQEYFFPDGFRAPGINEQLHLMNLETVLASHYQVIVRYETGERDSVIFTGGLAPNQRVTLRITNPNDPNYNIVRSNVGYSIIVRSTRAMSASINHRESGGMIAETLQMTARIGIGELRQWTLSGEKGPGIRSYLVYNNLTDQVATLNMQLVSQNGTVVNFGRTVEPFRRGGIAFHQFGVVPDGPFTIRILSTGLHPIGAAISQFRQGTGIAEASGGLGSMNYGGQPTGPAPGGGNYLQQTGYLAGAIIASNGDAKIDFAYNNPAVAFLNVDFYFYRSNGTVLSWEVEILTSAAKRKTLNLGALPINLPRDEYFTVRYVVRNSTTPVAVNYRARIGGDVISTPFQTQTSQYPGAIGTPLNGGLSFSDGFSDPANIPSGMHEVVSVFNPFANSSITLQVQMFVNFADGASISSDIIALGSLSRHDFRVSDVAAAVTKMTANPNHRFYSISLVAVGFFPPPVIPGNIVAQLTRVQNNIGASMTTLPALDVRMPVVPLNHPSFG